MTALAFAAAPLAAEAWAAVFGGLIPILGLIAIGYLIVRAVRDHEEDDG